MPPVLIIQPCPKTCFPEQGPQEEPTSSHGRYPSVFLCKKHSQNSSHTRRKITHRLGKRIEQDPSLILSAASSCHPKGSSKGRKTPWIYWPLLWVCMCHVPQAAPRKRFVLPEMRPPRGRGEPGRGGKSWKREPSTFGTSEDREVPEVTKMCPKNE